MLIPTLITATVTCGTIVVVSGLDSPVNVLGAASSLGLSAYWAFGFRRGRFSLAGEAVEALALLVVLLASPGQPPLPLFGTTFRALYGPLWLSMLRFVLWDAAINATALAHGSFALEDQLGKATSLVMAPLVMHALRATIERLQRNEVRLRSLLEHSTDVVTLVDADTRVLYQAPSIRAVLGYEPEAMIGQPLSALVHPDDSERFRRAVSADAPAPGETTTLDCRMRDAAGAYKDIEAVVGNRLHEPHIESLLLTLRDVTERRRQELQVRMQRSLRLESIGQLAGGVAHDFNNLLAVILNCAALMHDDLPPDEPAQEDVTQIQLAAERGARLVRQLLLFSRGESTAPQLVSLNTTIVAMDPLLSGTLPDNVRLQYDLENDLPPVYADATSLEQVIVNLVVNARDAIGPAGGEIVVATARTGEHVRLTVSDDGCGMDEATRERAIEPFFTTKAFGEGTGLGLATVHGIVTGAGGFLAIESEPGAGTSIAAHLPVGAHEDVLVQDSSPYVDPLCDASLT